MTHARSKSMGHEHILRLVITAVFIALTYVFTVFVNIRLPIAANGGLIHLGNVPLFICAILYGRWSGAIAGGVGMGLFDLLSGWTSWAPFTFVIVGAMGFVLGLLSEKKKTFPWNLLGMILALIIKIVGYYLAEWILYGNPWVPLSSIPGNVVQVVTAIVIVSIVIVPLKVASRRVLRIG